MTNDNTRVSGNGSGRQHSSIEVAESRRGATAATVRSRHRMPFGPRRVDELHPEAGYRFRLWAPGLENVEVCHFDADGERHYHVCAKSDGWHSCQVAQARAGDCYLFRLDGGREVPDPASRFNPKGVHGASQLIDPYAFGWDAGWHGRPWEEAVIYEMHVGTFTPEGRYDSAETRLDELAELGFTAIELMPVAGFSGCHGWGYDGVLMFAPHAAYGTPDELKHFIHTAHRRGMMVFLDVVYNHFGPDGNYLHGYAPEFFSAARETPWGEVINYDGPSSTAVRDFVIHNALYWLEEYHFDGLRLDAVHAIVDESRPDVLEELSTRVRAHVGRQVHLMLENVANEAGRLGPPATPGRYEAQWNDDFHHAAHVLLTGERDGYYADYADRPVVHLVRCLSEGFAFQGDYSAFHAGPRGERSADLPPGAFVNFLQNHDQVGNRAFGERLASLVPAHKLRALVALQLLAPSTPMIFMGEESGSTTPFLYFCDFSDELATAVRDGRRREFDAFERFSGELGASIPDPCDDETFRMSKLDWEQRSAADGRQWRAFYRRLLGLRRSVVIPRLHLLRTGCCTTVFYGEHAFEVRWPSADDCAFVLCANLGDTSSSGLPAFPGAPFAAVGPESAEPGRLMPWSVRAHIVATGADAQGADVQ